MSFISTKQKQVRPVFEQGNSIFAKEISEDIDNEKVKQDDLYDIYTVRVYNKDGSLAHIYKIKQHKIDLSRNI